MEPSLHDFSDNGLFFLGWFGTERRQEFDSEHGPIPDYDVGPQLSKLTMMFIVTAIIYFVIAGALALVMRSIQSNLMVGGTQDKTFGLFYASLTVHGQVMFFGFLSMLVLGLSYYLLSKFARNPLKSMRLAEWSFATLNAGVIMIIISGTMLFGGGWYNLMPLPFKPGNGGWPIMSAAIFLVGDTLVGIALTLFSINVLSTVLTGKIAAGVQRSELDYGEPNKLRAQQQEDTDYSQDMNIPAALRWASLLGISAWFPKSFRSKSPAVSIVVVGIFVNSLVQLMGNIGLFVQLANGFSYLTSPNYDANWLITKDAWWFFGHPIVYFTLFSFLGAAYYFIPRYAQKLVHYDPWAYRPWPFYFVFTMGVFSHHLYMDTPNPIWLEYIAQISSFGIVFPSGLTIMTIMMYVFRSRIKWNITSLFIIAGIGGWAFGGFTGVETGWWGQDVYLHNTENVVGHIHLVLLMGSVLMALGIIYAVVRQLTQKKLNKTLGLIHLILTVVGGFGLSLMFTYLGLGGFIRREAAIPTEFYWAMPWLLFFAVTVGIGQLVFVYNLFSTIARKREASEIESDQIASTADSTPPSKSITDSEA